MPTHPTVSASWPLSRAIAAAIEGAIAAGIPALDEPADGGDAVTIDDPPVWSGNVPEGTPLDSAYIVLGLSQQTEGRGTFRRKALENVETVDVWTADTSKRSALLIADALVALLNGVDLELAGYGVVRGRLELVLTAADPGTRQYRAQLRYSATSFSPLPA